MGVALLHSSMTIRETRSRFLPCNQQREHELTALVPEFAEWLENAVRGVEDQRGVKNHRALEAFSFGWIHELDHDAAFDQTETVTIGDGGVDGL